MNSSHHVKGSRRAWTMESFILGFLGSILCWIGWVKHPELSVIEETIVLVLFLGPLLGVAPLPLPRIRNLFWYPILAGIGSAFMDSFLVLLLIAALPLHGKDTHKLQFKAYVMIAALIGGLMLYFGEVYALPHYLKYGMRGLLDALPIFPPVIIFLLLVGFLTSRLHLKVGRFEKPEGNNKREGENFLEFAVFIAALLIFHNPIGCLGALMVYATISGQGEDFIHVVKSETEMGVMMLLVGAWLIYEPAQAYIATVGFDGWKLILPSMVNAVVTGALVPAGGNVWLEITLLSAGALFAPISSLVGIMIFKTPSEWFAYMRASIPLMIVWLILSLGWFYGIYFPYLQ